MSNIPLWWANNQQVLLILIIIAGISGTEAADTIALKIKDEVLKMKYC